MIMAGPNKTETLVNNVKEAKVFAEKIINDSGCSLEPNIISFFTLVALRVLVGVIDDWLSENENNTNDNNVVEQLLALNNKLLGEFILRPSSSHQNIWTLIDKYCQLLSKRMIYRDNEISSAQRFRCFFCMLDNCFIGLGRSENICGTSSNEKESRRLITSTDFTNRVFGEDLCSHYVENEDIKTSFDKIIASVN